MGEIHGIDVSHYQGNINWPMVLLYTQLIIIKERPFSKVPDKFKADVETLLKERGYDTDGNRIITT